MQDPLIRVTAGFLCWQSLFSPYDQPVYYEEEKWCYSPVIKVVGAKGRSNCSFRVLLKRSIRS